MLLFSINAIFAFICARFAFNTIPRGWQFIKSGWTIVKTQREQGDVSIDVESRRLASEGGTYLLAGVLWLIAALIAIALTAFFIWQGIIAIRPS